jgi:hypothetical protein
MSPAVLAHAQGNGYTVHLRKDYGYGGFGVNIRGKFTISLVGQEGQVQAVTFMIDNTPMVTVHEAPFKYQFQTGGYGFGFHVLSAEVVLKDGGTEVTPALQYNFVSREEEREQIGNILLIVGGVILLAYVIFALIQGIFFNDRARRGKTVVLGQNYGFFGGAVCPKCGAPFSRHIWGLKLVVGRLDRCDFCGKWVMTTRATQEALREAENAKLAEQEETQAATPIKETKDQLDQTRYIDQI